jgi:hypothetical protein
MADRGFPYGVAPYGCVDANRMYDNAVTRLDTLMAAVNG